MTLNIMVQLDVFLLANQFVDHFSQQVHDIRLLIDKAPLKRNKILEKIMELRKQLSYIILSYEKLYDTIELSPEE